MSVKNDVPNTTLSLNPQELFKLLLVGCMPDLDKVKTTGDLLKQ